MSCSLLWSSENKTMSSAKRRHVEGKKVHVMGTEEYVLWQVINK